MFFIWCNVCACFALKWQLLCSTDYYCFTPKLWMDTFRWPALMLHWDWKTINLWKEIICEKWMSTMFKHWKACTWNRVSLPLETCKSKLIDINPQSQQHKTFSYWWMVSLWLNIRQKKECNKPAELKCKFEKSQYLPMLNLQSLP